MRPIRQVSEREIAMALVLELAESGNISFSLLGFYDNDAEFIESLAERLDVKMDKAFVAKMVRVTRRLVRYDVLLSRMQSTQKYYVGEPAKQRNYWLQPGKAALLTRGQTDVTMTPEGEASFLVRHAYPNPDFV